MQTLQIWRVSRYMEIDDLPLSLSRVLVCAGHAFQHEAGPHRAIAFAHDILIGFDIRLSERKIGHSLPFLVSQGEDILQLSDDRTEFHRSAPRSVAGASVTLGISGLGSS
jgi:hypothetical protein